MTPQVSLTSVLEFEVAEVTRYRFFPIVSCVDSYYYFVTIILAELVMSEQNYGTDLESRLYFKRINWKITGI